MKLILQLTFYIFLLLATGFLSCKKDSSEEGNNSSNNKPPVASAGQDQAITLPINSCTLDGSTSNDPDGNISGYHWSKIQGPTSFTIQNRSTAQTIVNNLSVGVYRFELMVIDNGGLIAKDTVQVTVNPTDADTCDLSDRPQINATLTLIGTLSEPRAPSVAAADGKIVFAGGPSVFTNINGTKNSSPSAAVDIYDIDTKSWTRAQLSQARQGMAAVSCGNKIFFAGGSMRSVFFTGQDVYDNVDIYDVTSNTWTVAHLSEPRSFLAAAAIGSKVLFAGGTTDGMYGSKTVDIYDTVTKQWSVATLSEARFGLSAITSDNKVYFAGGSDRDKYYSRIDIYDTVNNSWSTSPLMELSNGVSGVALGDHIYWGGANWTQNTGKAEIWNTKNGGVTFSCLSYPRSHPTAVIKDENIVFFTSGNYGSFSTAENRFDIYNTITNKWSIGLLNQAITGAGFISVNSVIYSGGGVIDQNTFTDKVYTLNW
jgi:hypothetical protein